MWALTSVAQLVECRPTKQGVMGSIPGQAHAWAVGQVLSWGHTRGNQLMFLSHINVSLSFFLPSPFSKNK